MFSKILGYIFPKTETQVKTWGYFINGTKVKPVSDSKYDLVVVDSRDGEGKLFTKDQVSQMKKRSFGKDKLIIAYISLGEAEDYRPYWKKEWSNKKNRPTWLGLENPEWKGNYSIKQWWHSEWIQVTHSILDEVMNAGFDGIYIDKIDVYEDLGGSDKLKQRMIDYIINVSKYCKDKNPKFLIIPQNAEELSENKDYLDAVDGIGKESVCYSGELGEKQVKNSPQDIKYTINLLNNFARANKLVLVVEYVSGEQYKNALKIMNDNNFVCLSAEKELDKLV
jgi:cysteinyl-tRNA synthetase